MYKFIIIVLLFLSQIVKGQDSITLQLTHFPNKIYKSQIYLLTGGKGKLGRGSSSPFKEEIASSNIEFSGEYFGESELITHNEIKGRIPYVWKFRKSEYFENFNGSKSKIEDPLAGSTIYGFYDLPPQIEKVDSIQNNKLNISQKSALKLRLEKALNEFPKTPIIVGHSVEKETQVHFPLLGADGDQYFIVTTKYTLSKIENGIGYLDTHMIFRLKSPNNYIQLLPSTEGAGKIEYNIKEAYLRSEKYDYHIDIIVSQNGVVFPSQISSKKSILLSVENN